MGGVERKVKLTVGVDVDGVLADLHKEWIARYNRDFNDHLTSEDVTDWNIGDFVKPEALVKNANGIAPLFQYLQDPDLYEHVPEIPGARTGLEYIRYRDHDVVLVSSCVMNQTDQKMRWVVAHKMVKPMRGDTLLDFIGASSKHYIKVDALIDDRDKNVKETQGYRILFDSPWNWKTDVNDYDFRMLSWANVEETVDRLEHFWNAGAVLSTDV